MLVAEKFKEAAKKAREKKYDGDSKGLDKQYEILLPAIETQVEDGRIYLQLEPDKEGEAELYKAWSTPSAMKFLRKKGFVVELRGLALVIWWDEPNAIDKEINPEKYGEPVKEEEISPVKEVAEEVAAPEPATKKKAKEK